MGWPQQQNPHNMESSFPKSQIAGVQSVTPVAVTVDRKVRTISTGDPAGAGIFRRTLNIVLYYKHDTDDDQDLGWLVAAWIKESLGKALVEQPLLCGRMRRRMAEEGGESLEVVTNDSGARLVEAMIPVNMAEFLEVVKKEKRAEDEVVFWRDIDEDDPQFSPLFYVQVTIFQCGGYSIGISSSIVVADIVLEADFMRKWSETHSSIAPQTQHRSTSRNIFYLPKLKQDSSYLSLLPQSLSVKKRSQPIIFQIQPRPTNLDVIESCKKIVSVCAGIESRGRMSLWVSLFVREQGEDEGDEVKLEVSSRHEVAVNVIYEKSKGDGGTKTVDLEEVGLSKVGFWHGIPPDHTSCWVGSDSEGLVFVSLALAHVIVVIPK